MNFTTLEMIKTEFLHQTIVVKGERVRMTKIVEYLVDDYVILLGKNGKKYKLSVRSSLQ